MAVKQNGMKRTKHLSARGAKRQFHLLAVFCENILISVDTVNIWLGFGIGGLTMAEYLDREAFKKSVEERYCKPCKAEGKDHNGCWCRACWVDDMLDEVECFQLADVAPVVRCKECKHSWEDIGGLCCSHGVCVDLTVPDDFYCAYGIRKEGEESV